MNDNIKIDFREASMPGIDGSPATAGELDIIATNLATIIWRNSPTPDIQMIGQQLYSDKKADITKQQLRVIAEIIEKNELGLPPIALRYIMGYINA